MTDSRLTYGKSRRKYDETGTRNMTYNFEKTTEEGSFYPYEGADYIGRAYVGFSRAVPAWRSDRRAALSYRRYPVWYWSLWFMGDLLTVF